MNFPKANRKYTSEEKQQLLANLDIEVAHRIRQFESWLNDRLENFNMHQEGHVSRIPKQVRNMTMREFGEKYDGNVQAALRGFQKEKFVAAGGEGSLGELDKDARKRKWVASQEGTAETKDTETKAPKNARLTNLATPKKAGSSTGPGTAQRARLLANGNKTPGTSRTMGRVPPSPSTQKPRPPFGSNIGSSAYQSRQPFRPTSPAKAATSRTRVPSSSTFNLELPPKTPRYPSGGPPSTALRLPRRDESMLSVNGSPLANPYEFGMGWLKGMEMADPDTDNEDEQYSANTNGTKPRTLKQSSIMIRRDPSVAFPQHLDGTLHSRTNSQASMYTAASQPSSSAHSRENSLQLHPQSQPIQQSQLMYPTQLPTSHSQPNPTTTPRPIRTHTRSFSALVAIPTKDGHLLEFDPLQTSPGALDALEGITDSAKKQARVEMSRLVQAAVDKWKIG
ncbi:hypothetical protein D9615_002971 [Tricholomella constricta]|uniref:Borealin N-terminal domain-containing protein n=1 Tax=Tricholomella constricta TaxID=117010 RepID=A0A8H5HFS2_9AGAR|nr:hypothetical protein D9615_002971 [Tricholomella constricta]